jgi:hypothetical protein
MRVGSQSHAPGKSRYLLHGRLGGHQGRFGRAREMSPPPGFDPWNRPTRSESLYRLSYPGPTSASTWPKIGYFCGRNPSQDVLLCVDTKWKSSDIVVALSTFLIGGSDLTHSTYVFMYEYFSVLCSVHVETFLVSELQPTDHKTRLVITEQVIVILHFFFAFSR